MNKLTSISVNFSLIFSSLGGFNSNSGAVKDVNDNFSKGDSKHIEIEPESRGKGDKFIFDSLGVTRLIFNHGGDGNHGDDGSGDVKEVVIEKVSPDVDISQSTPVVTVSATKKIPDSTLKKVKPGIMEIDRSIFDGLLGSATVSAAAFNGSSGREVPSSARKDVSNAK
ncbi:hypothetical protein Tco_1211706 [Tanacetum coccineum]